MNTNIQNYRYPGASPFEARDRRIFFGRRNDIQELARLIRVEQMVLLYAKSGLGKTSLLNAGVMPLLTEKDAVLPVFIRLLSKPSANEAYHTPLTTALRVALQTTETAPIALDEVAAHALWLALKRLSLATPNRQIVLVFDQFEELFSYSDSEITEFATQLAEVLYLPLPQLYYEQLPMLAPEVQEQLLAPMHIKTVFAIRSDRMSLLARIQKQLPNILFRTYELQGLSREQAEFAILQPALKDDDPDKRFDTPQFEYAPDALSAILAHLAPNLDERVEAAPMQIILEYAERLVYSRTRGKTAAEAEKTAVEALAATNYSETALTISRADLGDLNEVYKNYYADILDSISPDAQNAERLRAQILIEDELIFENDRRRLSLYEGRVLSFLSQTNLDRLAQRHFLRPEPNASGGYTYELAHDTLVLPILSFKKIRKAREQAAREAELQAEIAKQQAEKAVLQALTKQAQTRTRIAVGVAIVALAAMVFAGVQYYNAGLLKDAAEFNSALSLNTLYQSKAKEFMQNGDNYAQIGKDRYDLARMQYDSASIIIARMETEKMGKSMQEKLKNELNAKRDALR